MKSSRFYGKILTVADMGKIVRNKRKTDGLSQREFTALCGVGNRFISDLENGKPTIRLDKTLQVLQALGLELAVSLKSWPR